MAGPQRTSIVRDDPKAEPLLLTEAQIDGFFEMLRTYGDIWAALHNLPAPVARAIQKRMLSDPVFAEDAKICAQQAVGKLMVEATERAVGVIETVYAKDGSIAGQKKVSSDQLLMFLLKGHKQDMFNPVQRTESTHRIELTPQQRLTRLNAFMLDNPGVLPSHSTSPSDSPPPDDLEAEFEDLL